MNPGLQQIRKWFEPARRISTPPFRRRIQWPDGPVCPHCGVIGEAFRLQGKTTRMGLWKCSGCRKPFTVMVGTIFEDSKIPLHKWLLAIHLLCSSKKGMSAQIRLEAQRRESQGERVCAP